MNNQINGLNVLLAPPIVYANPSIPNNQNQTLFPQLKLPEISEGINNVILPVIPIFLTQPNGENRPNIEFMRFRVPENGRGFRYMRRFNRENVNQPNR